MKIKCEYCGSFIDDTEDDCPNCGAVNENMKRVANGVPRTIEELKAFCVKHNLPLAMMRFYIGENYKLPRAYGIYKDEASGEFIVYKNKSDGSRAIRYQGLDEAYAVNEIYLKLQTEIQNQKMQQAQNAQKRSQNYNQSYNRNYNQNNRNIGSYNTYSTTSGAGNGKDPKKKLLTTIILIIFISMFGSSFLRAIFGIVGNSFFGGSSSRYESTYDSGWFDSSDFDVDYDYDDDDDSYDWDSSWDSDWDSDYDWDSGSDWDSGYSDWDSDW